jgi:hypothetical protein
MQVDGQLYIQAYQQVLSDAQFATVQKAVEVQLLTARVKELEMENGHLKAQMGMSPDPM